jgi:malate dehydrogenase
MTHLSVMGAGKIGGEVAYLSTIMGIADSLTLADCNAPFLNAQKLDIIHTGIDIDISTDPADIKNSDIIVFSAGKPRNPQIKTRADLLGENIPVAKEFCSKIKGFDGILICITNPVDAVNDYICRNSGIERERCIGFGGQLDLARFRNFLKSRGINPDGSVVLGEHGEHQVPLFSGLKEKVDNGTREKILSEMRGASMPVIKGKGGTVFGPAYNIARLIQAVKNGKNEIFPCSCCLKGEYGYSGLSIGVPAKIGKEGIIKIYEKDMDSWEKEKFSKAANHLINLCRRTHDR